MNTVKCKSCGEYIHIGNAFGKLCIYCGTPNENAPNNAEGETHIEKLTHEGEDLLNSSQFSKALKHYDEAIELYPSISQFYWGRLLAQKECSDDFDLIRKGIHIENEPDYSVALHFGNESEKNCYSKLNSVNKNISKEIFQLLFKSEIREKDETDIENEKFKAEKDISELRNQLAIQISNLDAEERKLRDLSIDTNSVLETEKARINTFVSKIEKVKTEVQSKSEVTYDSYNAYVQTLKKYQNLCNSEWNIIQSKSNIPTFDEIKKTKTAQSKFEREINQTIKQIEEVGSNMKQLCLTIYQIRKKYEIACDEIQNGTYSRAISLIGEGMFIGILQKYIKVAR